MPYIYFRDTSPPDCNIRYKKYIILYYDYSKRGPVKAKDGKPIFVPYLLLVSERFGEAISNYINIPVWNPAIVKYVTIRINRRYKKPLVKKKKKKRGKHHKKGKKGKHGKPQHQNMKGPHAKGKGKKKEEAPNQEELDKEAIEEKWRKRLERKRSKAKDVAKLEAARDYAKKNIDYWRAFDDREQPQMQIYDNLQQKHIRNGGYDLGVNKTLDYVKPQDINKYNLQNSVMFPPCYTNDAEMPAEAIVNFRDVRDSLIAKVLPPIPIVAGAKYTFFYIAPTKFKYPDGRRIWLPVFILVPEDSEERPTDLREFDTYKVHQMIGDGEEHHYIKSKLKPVWTPRKFANMLMNKKFVNMPQQPLDDEFFLTPKKFDDFLDEYELLNEGVNLKDTIKKPVYTDPLKKMLDKATEFLKFKKGLRTAIVDSFKPKNNNKLDEIIKRNKAQRLNLLNDLKRKHSMEASLMKKRVAELNKKLKTAQKVFNEQKKKLAEEKKQLDEVNKAAK